MIIYVKKVEGAVIPAQAAKKDESGNLVATNAAGYDIVATSDPTFWKDKAQITGETFDRIDYVEYKTNLFVAPSVKTFHSLILPRSSNSNFNLLLGNGIGLIDNDYRGQILFRWKYVWQPEDLVVTSPNYQIKGKVNFDKMYKKGDTIGQFVISPTVYVEYQWADSLDETLRGEGGFGHTNEHKPMTLEERLKKEKQDFESLKKNDVQPKSVLDRYREMGNSPTRVPYTELIKQRENQR
jgi:dUTP pyrophosphatase